MPHGDRISALDASFLRQEKAGARLHAASVTVFDGPAPSWDELRAHVESRLHLVPRFRQRLAEVPLQQGRPVWVDDPHFNLRYHLRHAGLPSPGSEEQLQVLAGRLFAQPLDRTKPLWEMWLVDRLGAGAGAGADGGNGDGGDDDEQHPWAGRFALIAKSHHALVDGISAVDITTVLFDTDPGARPPAAPGRPWVARPLPTPAQLLSDALIERATQPHELASAALRGPRRLLQGARERLDGAGVTSTSSPPAPATPLNVAVGPHRRYTWVDAELSQLQAIKASLGGTVNDAVLAVVAGALGRYLRHRGTDTRDLVLKALVPLSVYSSAADGGALGSKIAPLSAPLPVGIEDPVAQLRAIRDSVSELETAHQAIGARELTELDGFASPTLMSQAARLQQSQRSFNLVVTNVPGPQVPLYLLGRRLRALYPVVPITGRQALGIAVMSYDGRLGFGLLADYDALPDVDVLADDLRAAIAALLAGASIPQRAARGRRRVAARPSASSTV
ncbi:MAG TPA: wax ester/triacylglycerol synthase family O-acyltransferase [Solirubrobacteraceae bacterium]|jgi:WS/DGAT/MGAT family acyltransferase|nr:wax ester/triacylglycerol synthase family O-acyltransferase [Solirubrobacteraceae bacterium]